MSSSWKSVLSALSLAAIVVGCGGAKEEVAPPPAAAPAPAAGGEAAPAPAAGGEAAAPAGEAPAYTVAAVADGGTVSGKVTLTGTAPEAEKVEVTKDKEACGGDKVAETIKSTGGALANAVVWIDGIATGKDWAAKDGQLDQKECHYAPHVQGVAVGGNLEIMNSDPVLHNIHAYIGEDTLFNFAQPKQGDKSPKKMTKTGPVQLKCDVHSWMNAWVFVAANPYFAVTKDDGTYSLGDVPPGTYTVKAWHESLGTKDASVTVAAKGTVTSDFALEVK